PTTRVRLSGNRSPQDLHSFPTRRSSDLCAARFGLHPLLRANNGSVNLCHWTSLSQPTRLTLVLLSIFRRMGSGSRIPGRSMRLCLRAGSIDRKSTRLNSSHVSISYAVFCLKKKNHLALECDTHTLTY